MIQARRPAGTPVGGQFAPAHRPEATGIELGDGEQHPAPVAVGLDVDWAQLRRQKARLVELAHPHSELGGDPELDGIVHLLDNLQDQAAEVLGEKAVFGDLGDGATSLERDDETAVCDECGEVIEGELVCDQHAVWCSLHPGNVDGGSGAGLAHADDPRIESSGGPDEYRRFLARRSPSSGTSQLSSLADAMAAENSTWTWTGLAAEVGKERAAALFERAGGSLGTAIALASKPQRDPVEQSDALQGVLNRPPSRGELPVRLQAHLLRTANASADVATTAADTLDRQHEALRGIQALLSDPEWNGPADRLETIAMLIESAGYAHEDYRPEVGEPIELRHQLAGRTVAGRVEHVDGGKILVFPDSSTRPIQVLAGEIAWDRDSQTWFHEPPGEED